MIIRMKLVPNDELNHEGYWKEVSFIGEESIAAREALKAGFRESEALLAPHCTEGYHIVAVEMLNTGIDHAVGRTKA